MKKKISVVLIILIVFNLCAVVAMADKATATTMTLEKTEGTANVTNKSGKSISLRDGMKLYNGYNLSTETKSYAYIGLDGTKAVKLDSVSKAAVIQSGKKLEVDLKSGKLFFNVTAPLDEDESLNIRTSTMVTGIRGTSGWTHVINQNHTDTYLLTGEVIVISTDPLTGNTKTETLKAGEMMSSYTGGEAPSGEIVVHEKREFIETEVPGFVAQEVKKDADLQEKINEQTNLSVPIIIGDADEKLEQDEREQEQKQEQIDEDQSALDNEQSVDPLYKDDPAPPSGPGAPTVPSTSHTLTGTVTAAALQSALNTYTSVTLAAGSTTTITTSDTVSIAPGKTLTNHGAITLDGILRNDSNTSLYNEGTIAGGGSLQNGDNAPGNAVLNGTVSCVIYNWSNSTLTIGGTVTGNVIVQGGTAAISGTVTGDIRLFGGNTTISGTVNGPVLANDPTGTATITGIINGNVTVMDGTVNLDGGRVSASGGTTGVLVVGGMFNFTAGVVQSGTGFCVEVISGNAIYTSGLLLTGGTAVDGTLQSYTPPPTSSMNCIDVSIDGGKFTSVVRSSLGDLVVDVVNNANGYDVVFDTGTANANIVLPEDLVIPPGQSVEFRGTDDSNSYSFNFDGHYIINSGTLIISGYGIFKGDPGYQGFVNYGTISVEPYGQWAYVETSASLVNYGTLNISGELKQLDQFEGNVEVTFESTGTINIQNGGYFQLMNSKTNSIGGSGMNIYSGGEFGVYGNSDVSLSGSIKIHSGGVMTVETQIGHGFFVDNGGGINVAAGGALSLLRGQLTNGTGKATCITAANSNDVIISTWPTFALNGDSFASTVPTSLYSWAYRDGDVDKYEYYNDLTEAIAALAGFAPDTNPELIFALQSSEIIMPNTLDLSDDDNKVTLNLGTNTLVFNDADTAISGYKLAVTNGTIKHTNSSSGEFTGIFADWYLELVNVELIVTGTHIGGLPCGIAVGKTLDAINLFIVDSIVKVTSNAAYYDDSSAAVLMTLPGHWTLSIVGNTIIETSGALHAVRFGSSTSDIYGSFINYYVNDGYGIFTDSLPVFSFSATQNQHYTIVFRYSGGVLGSKEIPLSMNDFFGDGGPGWELKPDDNEKEIKISDTPNANGYYTLYLSRIQEGN